MRLPPHPSQEKACPFTICDLKNSASGAREAAKQMRRDALEPRADVVREGRGRRVRLRCSHALRGAEGRSKSKAERAQGGILEMMMRRQEESICCYGMPNHQWFKLLSGLPSSSMGNARANALENAFAYVRGTIEKLARVARGCEAGVEAELRSRDRA